MARGRITMRRIREILRLHFEQGLNQVEISQSCSISRSTVGDYLRRFAATGLSWPLPKETDDNLIVEELLYPKKKVTEKPQLNYEEIHKELSKKGVTLQLLWQEYKFQNPSGYQYSQFCRYYRNWKKTIDVSLRQQYQPGVYCFIDYAG